MQSYRKENLIPTLLIFLCGGTALAFMCWRLEFGVFGKWFLYPSLIFWSFSVYKLAVPLPKPWDHRVWRACKWWSGTWLLLFALGMCAPPFSVALWLLLAGISGLGMVNPFLALLLHLMIWACASDILKTLGPTQNPEQATTDH